MAYDRIRDLPRIMPLPDPEMNDFSIEGRKALIAKLRATLQRERQRGIDGHWCYSLPRHQRMLACYRSECRQLSELLDDDRSGVWVGEAHLVGVT